MNETPPKPADAKARIKLDRDGLTLYSNRAGLRALADWLGWLANSNPQEHFECHYRMTFEDEESQLHPGGSPSNVQLEIAESLRGHFVEPGPNEFGFELTFMHVTDEDLGAS